MMRFVLAFSLAALFTSSALAAPADQSGGAVVSAVERQFIARFVEWQMERSKFSRAAMPPSETRVRVLGPAQRDADGAAFVPFAIDTRYGTGEWIAAEMAGCVYVASSAVFVKRGAAFLAAADYFAEGAGKRRSVCAP